MLSLFKKAFRERDESIVSSLITHDNCFSWSTANNPSPTTIYYTFDNSQFSRGYLHGRESGPMPERLKGYIIKYMTQIANDTGYNFIYMEEDLHKYSKSVNKIIFTAYLDKVLEMHKKRKREIYGRAQSHRCVTGLTAIKPTVKTIKINTLTFDIHELLFEFVVQHEIFHALGLKHPNDQNTPKDIRYFNASHFDTLMRPRHEKEFYDCMSQANDTSSAKACIDKSLPRPFYTKNDLAAIEAQKRKMLDPDFMLDDGFFTEMNEKFRSFTSSLCQTAGLPFIQGFVSVIGKRYILPKLINEFHFSNRQATILRDSLDPILTLLLLSSSTALMWGAINFILTPALKKAGIETSKWQEMGSKIIFASLIVFKTGDAVKGLISGSTYCAGESAAWYLIQNALPKLHHEPATEDSTIKNIHKHRDLKLS